MKHILPNGIKVITDYVDSVETVCIGVFIKCGSKYEMQQHNGLAHLIEHLLFRENHIYQSGEVKEVFDKIGSKINAITTKEYICVHVKIIREFLDETIILLSNLLKYPSFNENDILLEKQIIINEINQFNDNHFERVQKNLVKVSFGNHPLSLDILGTQESLNSITKNDIIDFYNKFFVANNILISISGKFDQKVIESIEKNFASIQNRIEERTHLPNITYNSEITVEHAKISQCYLAIGIPAYSTLDSKLIPLLIFNNILGQGFSSVLYKKLREELALVYSIHSYPLNYTEGGLLIVTCSTTRKNLNTLIETIKELTLNMGKNGITKEELHKGVINLISYILFGLESIQSRMFEQGKSALLNIENNSIDLNNLHDSINRLKKYEVDEVNEVIKEITKIAPSVSIITDS